MGIGNFTDVVGADGVVCGSPRILAVFINSIPLLSIKILHKFSVVFL